MFQFLIPRRKPVNGETITIIEATNATGGTAYKGFTGIVHNCDSSGFSLYSGHSWLICPTDERAIIYRAQRTNYRTLI